MEKNNFIDIISQAFYGNRTHTEIDPEDIDYFLCGILDKSPISKVNSDSRVIVRVPNAEYIAIIYSSDEEIKRLKFIKELEPEGVRIDPLADIPELGLKIYSRCIVCRINEAGEPESLRPEDCAHFMKYLAR